MNYFRDRADRRSFKRASLTIRWVLPAIALGAFLAFYHLPATGAQITERPVRGLVNPSLFLVIGIGAAGLLLSRHGRCSRYNRLFVDSVTGLPSRRAVGSTLTLMRPNSTETEERYLLLISMSNLSELAAVLDSNVIDALPGCFGTRLCERLDSSRHTALRGRENRFFVSAIVNRESECRALARSICDEFRDNVKVAGHDIPGSHRHCAFSRRQAIRHSPSESRNSRALACQERIGGSHCLFRRRP